MLIRRSFATVPLLSLAILSAAGLALQPRPSDPPPPPSHEPGDHPPADAPRRGPGELSRAETPSVGAAMKGMNRSLRRLSAQLDTPDKHDDNLRLINDAERFCVIAKGQPVPPDVLEAAKDDAARAAMSKTFRADLIKVLRALVDVESAIADGKPADARSLLDRVVKLRDEGHDAMGVGDDE